MLMPWYKITLPFKECGINGQGQKLQDAFAARFIAQGGRPWAAGLFSQTAKDYEYVFYFISPDATGIVGPLIDAFKAEQCDAPSPPSLDIHGLHLAVGDARIFELLWPTKNP